MNLIRFVYIIALLIPLSAVSFGEVKSFTKERIEIVPAHQSQDQVIACVIQQLTEEATEEAGTFIHSGFKLKDGQIEQDETIIVKGSISEVIIEEKESFTKDKQIYVRVKVKIKVDTENVEVFSQNNGNWTVYRKTSRILDR